MMAKVQNGEKYCRSFNPMSRAHDWHERQTDRRICDTKSTRTLHSHVFVIMNLRQFSKNVERGTVFPQQ